jgi:hypothetical protein
MTPRFLYLAALACVTSAPVVAASPIDTDGPDFVDSSEAVGKDRFQIEQDAISERDRRNAQLCRTVSAPSLMRYGIGETLELRLTGDIQRRETTASRGINTTVEGHGDLGMGVKWHAQDRDPSANLPAVSWIFQLDTPSGSQDFRGRGIRPSLRSVVTWDLAQQYSLALMPGLGHETRADGHRFTSALLGMNIGKRISERLRIFAESSTAQIARAENGGVVSAWDLGAAFLLSDDWQFGGRFEFAANRNSPSNAVFIEIAGRF